MDESTANTIALKICLCLFKLHGRLSTRLAAQRRRLKGDDWSTEDRISTNSVNGSAVKREVKCI